MDAFSMDDLLQYRTGLDADVLEALSEYAGVGLFNLYLPGGDIALNHNTTLLTGYQPGDLPHTGNTKEQLTFEDDRERVNACMQALFAGESDRYQLEYRMRRQDGSVVAVRESGLVYEWDKDGKPMRLAGLGQDLSRLRWAEERARAAEKEVKRLAQTQGEGQLAEQNRLLRAANAAAAMIIGGFHQDYETVLQQALQILAESIEAERVVLMRNTEHDGRPSCFLRAQWAKGSYVTLEDTAPLAYDDILPGWRDMLHEGFSLRVRTDKLPEVLAHFPLAPDTKSILLAPLYLHGEFWGLLGFDNCEKPRNYTEDEAEIMVSGARVIASSVSRNETFSKLNEAREEAMASTRAKGEFLSRMSHEIRTPMNAIIGMTTIAKKTSDPERIRYCLDKVDASSRQLLSIINDVLDMSKIDSGKFEVACAPFDFEKMVQNVFNVVQVKLEEKHQDFRVDFDTVFTRQVVSDELRLSQVLINLLGNAAKFTGESGKIRLNVSQTPLDDDTSTLRIEVADNGIGIGEEKQKKLFQSFEQADGSITRAYGGTGLGLAISKRIVNLLGGEIWVESTPGEGARFIFTIPVSWGDELLGEETVQSLPTKMRILVVDDAEDVRLYFKNILGGFHLACDAAANGEEAVAMVQQGVAEGRPYDMIFIDWNMPGMNGGDTAAAIRRATDTNAVVVMISVADWADIEQDAKARGVDNFLAKPVLPSMLFNTIVKLTDNTLVTEKTPENDAVYDFAGKTILLAEDIEINREIIQTVLADTGVSIVSACDGQQAVEAFAAQPTRFDLVLMDVQMPRLDGLSATRQIRGMAEPWAKEVPILAMTANAFKEDAQLCLDAGMDGHLAKPLDVDELLRVLAGYLGR